MHPCQAIGHPPTGDGHDLDPARPTMLSRCSASTGTAAPGSIRVDREGNAMTLQTVLDEIRKRPGIGRGHSDHRSRDRRDDHRIHRLRSRSGRRSRRAGEGLLRVGCLVAAAGPRAGQDLVADRGLDRRTRRRVRPTRLAQHRHAADAGAVADVHRSEFFRYYAGWCSKINGVAYDVKTDGIATRRLSSTCTPTPSKSPTAWWG